MASVTRPWISVVTKPCTCGKGEPPSPLARRGPPQPRCQVEEVYLSRRPSAFLRPNGLARPLNFLQILSWILLGFDILVFYVTIIPCLSLTLAITFGVLVGFFASGVVYNAYKVTILDPADPNICHKRDPSQLVEDIENKAYCDLCGPVKSRSKHCRACNKCVDTFDHHCKWLNNCVGKVNYRYFIFLILSVACLSAIFVAMSLYVLIEAFVCNPMNCGPERYWNDRYGGYHIAIVIVFTSLLIVVNVPLFVLDFHLVCLHIYLMKHGLTTFEYITQRVEVPVVETNGSGDGEKKFCGDWIIIDKEKLNRARDRFRRKKETELQPASSSA